MSNPKKIAHIVYDLRDDNFKNTLMALIYKLQQDGVHAEIINIVDEAQDKKDIKLRGIEIHEFNKQQGFDFKLLRNLKKFLKEKKYSVVHTHHTEVLTYGTLAARFSGIKSIYSRHNESEKYSPRFIANLNKHIVSSSQYIQRKLIEQKKISQKKCKLIYDGIDALTYEKRIPSEEKKELRQKLGLKEDSFLIGNIGPLISTEEQSTLIKALRKLIQKNLDAELVFIGVGPLKEPLIQLAEHYQIQNCIKFVGCELQKFEYLQLFDVVVHCAHKEQYPFTILEAMAAGTPVIATKIGANEEVILERKTGYLVPCGFPERIDSAIMRLNAIKTLASDMGESARNHIINDFHIDKMALEYEKLYD